MFNCNPFGYYIICVELINYAICLSEVCMSSLLLLFFFRKFNRKYNLF